MTKEMRQSTRDQVKSGTKYLEQKDKGCKLVTGSRGEKETNKKCERSEQASRKVVDIKSIRGRVEWVGE